MMSFVKKNKFLDIHSSFLQYPSFMMQFHIGSRPCGKRFVCSGDVIEEKA